MKRGSILKGILLFILLGLTAQANAGNFIYPFAEVAVPKCRFSGWSTLSNDCKMPLPRIIGADYQKYKDDKNMRKVYSILWGATYTYGWDVGFGSHLGVDIATSEGTPVRSIGDGQVITAKWLSGWGNTVVIKHKLSDGKSVFSNYSHLNKIIAAVGPIRAGEQIGEVGATGNAYGNHLHFQIDILDQSHPYWYSTCSKGIDIFDLVNNGQCRDFLLANTVDPIVFLEGNGSFSSVADIRQKQSQTKKIDQTNMKTREQILEEEIDEFLKGHTFDFKTNVNGDNLIVGSRYTTQVYVYKNGKPFTGNLPGKGIEFVASSKDVQVMPGNIIAIEGGVRNVEIRGTSSSQQSINLMLGKRMLFTKTINFFTSGDNADPREAEIAFGGMKTSLGEEKQGAVVFKTKYGNQQVYIPYGGTYILRTTSGKAKMCNVSKKENGKCNPMEMASEIRFRYEDTKFGVLLFHIVALDYMPIKLTLSKIGFKYDIAWTKTSMLVNHPQGLSTEYPYFNDDIEALKRLYVRLEKGYLMQDREFVGGGLKDLLYSIYCYEYLKSGNDLERKQKVGEKMKTTLTKLNRIDNGKSLSRGELAAILFDAYGLELVKGGKAVLNDEKGTYIDYMVTLRTKYSFSWKDQYAQNYFQPDKGITLGEALYMAYRLSPYMRF